MRSERGLMRSMFVWFVRIKCVAVSGQYRAENGWVSESQG